MQTFPNIIDVHVLTQLPMMGFLCRQILFPWWGLWSIFQQVWVLLLDQEKDIRGCLLDVWSGLLIAQPQSWFSIQQHLNPTNIRLIFLTSSSDNLSFPCLKDFFYIKIYRGLKSKQKISLFSIKTNGIYTALCFHLDWQRNSGDEFCWWQKEILG